MAAATFRDKAAIADVGYTPFSRGSGGGAVVVTSADRARDLRRPPVLIFGAVWGGGDSFLSGAGPAGGTDFTASEAARIAPRLYTMAGAGRRCRLQHARSRDAGRGGFVDVDDNLTLVQWRPKG